MRNIALAVTLVPFLATGCRPGEGRSDVFTDEEFDLIAEFALVDPPPADSTNVYADDPAAAAFGQKLFFEKGYAQALTIEGSELGEVGETGKVACASCHDPASYYSDTRSRPPATSLGIAWTFRNAPSLVNASYYTWGSWGGKDDTQWNQGANSSESPQDFGGNRLQVAHLVFQKYRADYDAIFPVPLDPALDPEAPGPGRFPPDGKPKAGGAPDGPWEAMAAEDRRIVDQILANAGKSLQAYERKLISRNAPIDRYIAGDHEAISSAAKRGLALFIGKAACVDCHSGPTFSDQQFHNTGVPQTFGTAARTDDGRFDDLTKTLSNAFNGAGVYSDDPEAGVAKLASLEPTEELKGLFRTSALRHVAHTGPYMHNGSLESLSDVVRFYNWGGGASDFTGEKDARMVPLGLTQKEEADLAAFLEEALTGDPPPPELGDDTAILDP